MAWLGIWVVIIKAIANAYGIVGSVRARFAPGIVVLVVSLVATLLVPTSAWRDTETIGAHQALGRLLLPLVLSAAVGAIVTRRAFRGLDATIAGSAQESALESAAYGLLGNTLLDAAILVLSTIAWLLTSTR